MHKYILFIFFLHAAVFAQKESPSLQDLDADGTMADRRLLSIVKGQQALVERVAQSADADGNVNPDLERQLTQLSQDWQSYVSDNPEDLEARILYGKFLRQFGQNESAIEQFLMADKLDDSLPVVKQQIGNYLAEHGQYSEALTWFLQAIALAPKEARYHFQMGELLYRYRWQFLEDGAFTRWALDQDIKTAFREAATLLPQDFQVNLRYAESYYDLQKPDWDAALGAFTQALPLARSEKEMQTVHLHLARVHMELGNRDDCFKHLSFVKLPAFEAPKQQVLEALAD